MNAKTVTLFVLFLAFGFIAKAEIPGGVVYSDGKSAIYYDLEAKESKNLTSDLSEAVVKRPFAISDNGKVLIWLQNYRFYVRELPIGTPRAIQVNKMVIKMITGNRAESSRENDIVEDIIWQGGDIKNMSLSPDGARFAFDTIFQEHIRESWYPFRSRGIDSCNGIFYLSAILNLSAPIPGVPIELNFNPIELNFSHPRYGNVAKIKRPDSHDMELNSEQIYYKSQIKKNAHYLCFQNIKNWEEGKKLAAFIYQIGNQWGPIEIRVLDSKTQGGTGDGIHQIGSSYYNTEKEEPPENIQKCREWEVLVSSKLCEGLFWKPDGSLTIESGGDLYSIDALQIQEGINNSGVKKELKGNMAKFLPFNNIFRAEPRLIAQGINGTCIFWVSNDAFLFLDKDMFVCLWRQGKTEKVSHSPISSELYYCSRSPFGDIAIIPSVVSNGINIPPAISGKDRAIESTLGDQKGDGINIGSIRTSWTDERMGNSVVIWIKKHPVYAKKERALNKKEVGLEYVLTEETDLNNIKDPSQYEYQSRDEKRKPTEPNFNVQVNLNKIIILKSGNDYAAIKPIDINPRFPAPKKSWHEEWLTYEWKFWSNIIPPAVAETALNK